MLEQRIKEYKQTGFSHHMEAVAARAQNPGSTPQAKAQLADHVKQLEAQRDNAYAAAKGLQKLLDELPTDEPKEADAE
jgi:hypothetical protein